MSRLLYVICLLCILTNAKAQDREIKFENSSFQEALNKAKEADKLLFVDCYTSWCGPCKMLARDVFTNNEVADYFNEHFVSLKIDCEKGEGPKIREKFGVVSYPTMLFLKGNGKLVAKVTGASKPSTFLKKVKEALNPKTSLFAKEQRYQAGERDEAFLIDLINSYMDIREFPKAGKISKELLTSMNENKLITKEMWPIISFYYVSPYGSEWWNFILQHADEYEKLVGKDAISRMIGERLHPYLFRYAVASEKAENKQVFNEVKKLITEYQPSQQKTLEQFIELGESASFDSFNHYFKTIQKVLPELDMAEHYRFWANAFQYLYDNSNDRQKKELLTLLKDSQAKSNDYMKQLYIDKFNL